MKCVCTETGANSMRIYIYLPRFTFYPSIAHVSICLISLRAFGVPIHKNQIHFKSKSNFNEQMLIVKQTTDHLPGRHKRSDKQKQLASSSKLPI